MIILIALTEAGKRLAERIQAVLAASNTDSALWYRPQPFAEQVQRAFRRGDALIFICATGIVVRTLAPVIQDKRQDPPVLVLDEQGQFVIPLLSGHQGGANEWAAQLVERLRAQGLAPQLVSTTANPYLQPVYTAGLGCERNCPEEELRRLLDSCLVKAGLVIGQLDSLNSIAIKADETGLIGLAATLATPYQTWEVAQLATMDRWLSTRSDYVFNTVGVYGVAESAALYAAFYATSYATSYATPQRSGTAPELVLVKHKTAKATCAIARSYPAQASA
ncbi:MAG: cobalt-precorrin 5A hydrolase [Motiliproteus sp.]|jgi:cobalt-precorrin 5A hydrolase